MNGNVKNESYRYNLRILSRFPGGDKICLLGGILAFRIPLHDCPSSSSEIDSLGELFFVYVRLCFPPCSNICWDNDNELDNVLYEVRNELFENNSEGAAFFCNADVKSESLIKLSFLLEI